MIEKSGATISNLFGVAPLFKIFLGLLRFSIIGYKSLFLFAGEESLEAGVDGIAQVIDICAAIAFG